MDAPLDGVDLRHLIDPDDAASARVVQTAFALGIRLPRQPENLCPERPGRERLVGVEADLLESRDGHAAHGSGRNVEARPAARPGGRGPGWGSGPRPDPMPPRRATDDHRGAGSRAAGPRLRSWTQWRWATALVQPGVGQPP